MTYRGVMSPAAARLLQLVTPEPCPLAAHLAGAPAVSELQRLGLVRVMHTPGGYDIALSDAGRAYCPVHRQ